MKNEDLQFDRTCHVLYSAACEKEIKSKIALHYPQERAEEIWTSVQLKYVDFLKDWRTDLGGKKNFHNGNGGTYDCIALMSYYVVCKDETSLQELEEMEGNLFLKAFRKMKFVNCNKPIFKKLLHKAFKISKKKCDVWHDYEMQVSPYEKGEPIRYEFTRCPVAEFAKQHGLTEIMPAMCNPDYKAMELIRARLIRTTTCANGDRCDYAICGDNDDYVKNHPEYVDEAGFRRNK